MSEINLEIAEKSLSLCKKMFKAFTGQEIEFAKEIISIEEQIKAIKGPQQGVLGKTENNESKQTSTPPPKQEPSPQTAPQGTIGQDDDLPF
jgi:hypothetical protein